MAQWKEAVIKCTGCSSYRVGNIHILKGREKTVTDKKVADRFRGVKGVCVKDIFDDGSVEYTNEPPPVARKRGRPVKKD